MNSSITTLLVLAGLLLLAVIAARNDASAAGAAAAAQPGDPAAGKALAGADGVLTGTLGRLFALSEAYPDLKATRPCWGCWKS